MTRLEKKCLVISDAHNAAMDSLTDGQRDALDRLIAASLIIQMMLLDSVSPGSENIPEMRQNAINLILEQEASGKSYRCPWWHDDDEVLH